MKISQREKIEEQFRNRVCNITMAYKTIHNSWSCDYMYDA